MISHLCSTLLFYTYKALEGVVTPRPLVYSLCGVFSRVLLLVPSSGAAASLSVFSFLVRLRLTEVRSGDVPSRRGWSSASIFARPSSCLCVLWSPFSPSALLPISVSRVSRDWLASPYITLSSFMSSILSGGSFIPVPIVVAMSYPLHRCDFLQVSTKSPVRWKFLVLPEMLIVPLHEVQLSPLHCCLRRFQTARQISSVLCVRVFHCYDLAPSFLPRCFQWSLCMVAYRFPGGAVLILVPRFVTSITSYGLPLLRY